MQDELGNFTLLRKLARKIWFAVRFLNKISVLIVFTVPALLISSVSRGGGRSNKILIGIKEIASNIHSIQKTLDAAGYTTHAVIFSNKFSQENQFGPLSERGSREYVTIQGKKKLINAFNYLLLDWKLALRLIQCLQTYQIWYFIWSTTFLPLNLDLFFLKLAKKKLIMMQCGSEVRYRPLQREIDKIFSVYAWKNTKQSKIEFLRKFYFVALSEALSDHIISHRDQATFQQVPYLYFRFPMSAISREEKKIGSKPVRILHVPSDRVIKKTDIVLEAISLLKNYSHDFEFLLVENVPNDAVIRQLCTADILIDQQGTWAGRLAIEGCATRCAVIGGNNSNYIARYDSPIIQFPSTAAELSKKILSLIQDPIFLSNKKEECYRFWENNYSPERFCVFFKNMLENKLQFSRDYFYPLANQREVLIDAAARGPIFIFLYIFYRPERKRESCGNPPEK